MKDFRAYALVSFLAQHSLMLIPPPPGERRDHQAGEGDMTYDMAVTARSNALFRWSWVLQRVGATSQENGGAFCLSRLPHGADGTTR